MSETSRTIYDTTKYSSPEASGQAALVERLERIRACFESIGRHEYDSLEVRSALTDAITALSTASPAPAEAEIIVKAYHEAMENWSAQCFCFTSAPESLRRSAHETARDGFLSLYTLLGTIARPLLDAEWREVEAKAKEAASPAPCEGDCVIRRPDCRSECLGTVPASPSLMARIKAWREGRGPCWGEGGMESPFGLLCEAEDALIEKDRHLDERAATAERLRRTTDAATKKLRKAFDEMLIAEVHRYGGIPHLQPNEIWFREVLAEFLEGEHNKE